MVDGARGEWIVVPSSEEHREPIWSERGPVSVAVGVDRRVKYRPRAEWFIRGIPGRHVNFEDEVRGHSGEIGRELIVADTDRTLEEGRVDARPEIHHLAPRVIDRSSV